MNKLSWIIYVANTADNLTGFLVLICAFIILYIAFGTLIVSLDNDGEFTWAKYSGRLVIVFLIFSILSIFIPSGRTIYLIAASQGSANILKSGKLNPAEKLLNTWIKHETLKLDKQNKQIQNTKK